ncbi:MAG: DMT family transporter [SAR324 cluster bacterium]|nr:DMT family transporter [SAR324 cluster bacterium]
MTLRDLSWKQTYTGYLLAVAGMTGAGLTAIPYAIALKTVSPMGVVYGMFGCAFLMSVPGILWKRPKVLVPFPMFLVLLGVAGLATLGNYAIGKAFLGMAPTLGMIIQRGEVMLAMLMSWLFLREQTGLRLWGGMLVSLGGVVVTKIDSLTFDLAGWTPVLWAVCSAAAFAATQVVSKKIIHRVDPQVINFWRLGFSVFFMSLDAQLISEVQQLGAFEWRLLILLGLLGPFGARLAYIYSLRYLPVSKTVLISTFTPVSTLITEFLVLGHWLSWYEGLGGVLILSGILFALFPTQREKL